MQEEEEAAPSSSFSLWVGVRGLASLPVGMREIVQSLSESTSTPLCMVKATSLPITYCKKPDDVLHPGGLPEHI